MRTHFLDLAYFLSPPQASLNLGSHIQKKMKHNQVIGLCFQAAFMIKMIQGFRDAIMTGTLSQVSKGHCRVNGILESIRVWS